MLLFKPVYGRLLNPNLKYTVQQILNPSVGMHMENINNNDLLLGLIPHYANELR